jgi:Uma2 family endonuclease
MARKKRKSSKNVWRRIPKEVRPTWEEWKKLCWQRGDPRLAEIEVLQRAIYEMAHPKEEQ